MLATKVCYNINMDYENYIWDLGRTLLDNYESSSHAFAATLWSMAERVVLRTDVYDALKGFQRLTLLKNMPVICQAFWKNTKS